MHNLNTANNLLASVATYPKSKSKTESYDTLLDRLKEKTAQIGVVGLGYVGLPIALEFAKKYKVIGYDINSTRVAMMGRGEDPSRELPPAAFRNKDIRFTFSKSQLAPADIYLVAVPTPVDKSLEPNLKPLKNACMAIAPTLRKGNIVVFESTVYPGCTEEVCIPILEIGSGLKVGEDFKVGYSPERINPGDQNNTLTTITKIVSGCDEISAEVIADVYDSILEAGVHVAPSIKVAEAAKIVENTQRDVNIALMNELSNCFSAMGIDTQSVLKAAGTKWNFLNFYPGLVGGHCIGVDPYYLIHKASTSGIALPLIETSRRTNDDMPQQVVDRVAAALNQQGKSICTANVLVLGTTFKENVSDIRNSKAAELAQLLDNVCDTVDVVDPHADVLEMKQHYQLRLSPVIESDYDVIVYAVNHQDFEHIDWQLIASIRAEKCVVMDFKNLLNPNEISSDVTYLTL